MSYKFAVTSAKEEIENLKVQKNIRITTIKKLEKNLADLIKQFPEAKVPKKIDYSEYTLEFDGEKFMLMITLETTALTEMNFKIIDTYYEKCREIYDEVLHNIKEWI